MLDRSIPTREALVYFIPISEVKDMKSDVLRALKASLSEKKLWTLFASLILTILKKKNCIDFEFLYATFLLLGLEKNWNSLAIPFFFPPHTHSYFWFFWSIKIKFKKKNHFLMSIHLTSLRYFQGAPANKQIHIYWKF
jgi:hypothetical protein